MYRIEDNLRLGYGLELKFLIIDSRDEKFSKPIVDASGIAEESRSRLLSSPYISLEMKILDLFYFKPYINITKNQDWFAAGGIRLSKIFR